MSAAMDFSTYSTILFMDSMVALEGKPLASLPWKEIDAAGPILVLVVPQVMKEIDKRKRDGRLGKRAREFNRLIGPAAESASTAPITAGPPTVDIAFATINKIDWDAFDDLDPEEGDARVVAQILYARDVPKENRLLFSHDNNPIAMAARHGVKTRKMPDHWLLEPEPSPHDKELIKLKSQVQELQAQEPAVDTALTFGGPAPLQLYRVSPLSSDQQLDFKNRILEANRKVSQNSNLFLSFQDDHTYDERYEKYRDQTVPRHAAQVHRYLEDEYSQIPFTFSVNCSGHIQAENLIITLRALKGGLYDRFICYPIHGPSAPQPRNGYLSRLNLRQNFPDIKQPVGRHAMEFAVGPDGGEIIEIHCADFRHGRTWTFHGIVRIDPHSDSSFKICVQVTASNWHGSIDQVFDLDFTSKQVRVDELINLEGGGFLVDLPMQLEIQKALETDKKDWFDFSRARSGADDDED